MISCTGNNMDKYNIEAGMALGCFSGPEEFIKWCDDCERKERERFEFRESFRSEVPDEEFEPGEPDAPEDIELFAMMLGITPEEAHETIDVVRKVVK